MRAYVATATSASATDAAGVPAVAVPAGGERVALLFVVVWCRVGQNTSGGQLCTIHRLVIRRMNMSALCWACHPSGPISIHALSMDRRRSSDSSSRKARRLSTTTDASSATKMFLGPRTIHVTSLLRKNLSPDLRWSPVTMTSLKGGS